MLDGFVHDRVEPVVGHDLACKEKPEKERVRQYLLR
jgi:hypothetical protein